MSDPRWPGRRGSPVDENAALPTIEEFEPLDGSIADTQPFSQPSGSMSPEARSEAGRHGLAAPAPTQSWTLFIGRGCGNITVGRVRQITDCTCGKRGSSEACPDDAIRVVRETLYREAEARAEALTRALERVIEAEHSKLDPEMRLASCPDCGSDQRELRKFRQRSARQLGEPARSRALAEEEKNGTVLYSPEPESCAHPWHNWDGSPISESDRIACTALAETSRVCSDCGSDRETPMYTDLDRGTTCPNPFHAETSPPQARAEECTCHYLEGHIDEDPDCPVHTPEQGEAK